MKNILLTIGLFLNLSVIYSQAPTIQWQKCFGGAGNEYAYSIQQTADGGYIIAGGGSQSTGDITGNHGSIDFWIVKLNNVGVIVWQKSLGGTGVEEAEFIQETADGFIIAGKSNSNNGDVTGNHGSNDYWVVKLDNSGVIVWQKSFGGSASDVAYSVQQTNDDGYIVFGTSSSIDGDITGGHSGFDCWAIKLDSLGQIVWQKSFGGSGNDYGYNIRQTIDGGFVFAGASGSVDGDVTVSNHGGIDFWIVKLNNLGTIAWQKSLGGTGNEYAFSIEQTSDGGYIVGGASESSDGDLTVNNGNQDYWVVKLDSLGTIVWQRSLGGAGNEYSSSNVKQTIDGGYILSVTSESINGDITDNHGLNDYWIVKLNNIGAIEWQKTLGGSADDNVYSIEQTTDGGYIVAGGSGSTDGDITSGNNGTFDYWIVKLNSIVGLTPYEIKDLVLISPNPSLGQFQISNLKNGDQIEVYDLTGRLILNKVSRSNSIFIDLSDKVNGIYFFKIYGSSAYSGKLIKQ